MTQSRTLQGRGFTEYERVTIEFGRRLFGAAVQRNDGSGWKMIDPETRELYPGIEYELETELVFAGPELPMIEIRHDFDRVSSDRVLVDPNDAGRITIRRCSEWIFGEPE